MRRTLFAAVVFLVLFAVASLCEAGEVETKKSMRIEISGEIKLNSLFENREVNTVIYGLTGTGARQSSATFSDPTITLNFDVKLAKQVNALVSLKTPEYMLDDLGAPANSLAAPNDYPSRLLEVDQAYVHIDEFGFPGLSLRLGIQEVVYDLLDDDNPFFLAIGRCEDAFSNNFQAPGSGLLELNGPTLAGSIEAGGVRASVNAKGSRMAFRGDLLYATVLETRQTDQDREVIALVGTMFVPNEKEPIGKVMMTLASFQHDPSSRFWTLGLGSSVMASKSLQLFAEGYGQIGTYIRNFNPIPPGTDPVQLCTDPKYFGKDIYQQAFGGRGGFKYTSKSAWKWHFGLEWWWLSGDRDRTDRKQQCFISYEDVDDLIILEENNYGYDLDTNYSAVKLRTGFKPGRDWSVDFLYANIRTARTIKADPGLGVRGWDKIGDELDVQVKWDYTEDISFRAGMGLLWNAKYFKPIFKHAKTHEVIFLEATLRF